MFVLDLEVDGPTLLGGEQWALVTSASFEDRCTAVAARTTAFPPLFARVLDPKDEENFWRAECEAKQAPNLAALVSMLSTATATSVKALDDDVAAVCTQVIDDVAADMVRRGASVLMVDISTLPKRMMFPLVRAAMRHGHVEKLLCAYTEPAGYGNTLHSEPAPPHTLSGHNHLLTDTDTLLAWLPILGFGSFFAQSVYDAIAPAGRLEHRVFPVLGFPGFDPSLYDRMLVDNGAGLIQMLTRFPTIREQFVYAPASDPFETRDALLRVMGQLPDDVYWIGTPLGPRPMALGMLLAALEKPLSVMHCQAKSYSPDYSHGARDVRVYPLKGW